MTQAGAFLFCPYDATRLETKQDAEGHPRPTCPACGFIDYANPKPCVAVLIEQEGRLLVARRGIEPAKGLWDIPGGFIHTSETAEEAVHREILEETGLQIAITRYLGSFIDTYGPRGEGTLNFGYVAVPTGGTPRPASDVAELHWFAPGELPDVWAFPHQEHVIRAWTAGQS